MTTYKDLTKEEKVLVNEITNEAIQLVKKNAEGYEFVRINLYLNAIKELTDKGETQLEICGTHFFQGSNSDDIDKSNQFEIFSFDQDSMNWVEGNGEWDDTERGQKWLEDAEKVINQNIIYYLFE